jgi:hypothetical protein
MILSEHDEFHPCPWGCGYEEGFLRWTRVDTDGQVWAYSGTFGTMHVCNRGDKP